MATLQDLSKPSYEQLLAQLQDAQAKLVAAQTPKALSMKVTEKGAISIYGLQRFPVTLYQSQWERVLGHKGEIEAFITQNKGKLATKG